MNRRSCLQLHWHCVEGVCVVITIFRPVSRHWLHVEASTDALPQHWKSTGLPGQVKDDLPDAPVTDIYIGSPPKDNSSWKSLKSAGSHFFFFFFLKPSRVELLSLNRDGGPIP